MKQIAIILLLVLTAQMLSSQGYLNHRRKSFGVEAAGGGGSPVDPGDLEWDENFEADEYDESVTEWAGDTLDGNYTTSPAPLSGSESFYAVNAVAGIAGIYGPNNTITADPSRWLVQIHIEDSEYTQDIFALWNNFSVECFIKIVGVDEDGSDTEHELVIQHGTVASSATVGTMTEGNTYWLWIEYNDSANTASVGFSSDGTRPTSGNNYTSVSSGDGGPGKRPVLGGDASDASNPIIYDTWWGGPTWVSNF